MENIKEAFNLVKQDIDFLNQEIGSLKKELFKLKILMKNIYKNLIPSNRKCLIQEQEIIPTQEIGKPTHKHQTDKEKENYNILKQEDIGSSTGNTGVPTDKQTNRQTNQHTTISNGKDKNSVDQAVEILDSLDLIKKDLRLKFKRLTDQEVLVFSALAQIEEEKGFGDYKSLSEKLNLTESSIRDYIGRLVKKGIPVEKNKINNKYIHLRISSNLKKIASIPTILKLREL